MDIFKLLIFLHKTAAKFTFLFLCMLRSLILLLLSLLLPLPSSVLILTLPLKKKTKIKKNAFIERHTALIACGTLQKEEDWFFHRLLLLDWFHFIFCWDFLIVCSSSSFS